MDSFNDKVNVSDDLVDELGDLVDHLKYFTKATGCYVGKLVKPKKAITDDDNEKAHIDPEAEEVIKFIHANKDHEFIVDQILTKEQGLSHDVFAVEEDPEPDFTEEEQEKMAELPEEEQEKLKKDRVAELVAKRDAQNKYTKEVVREPRMYFFRVPQLGSHLAIELKYNACLCQKSFETAYETHKNCQTKRLDVEKEKEEFEQEQKDAKEKADEAGETIESAEEKTWAEFKEDPHETYHEKYVVCLDTMGQDREFTEE